MPTAAQLHNICFQNVPSEENSKNSTSAINCQHVESKHTHVHSTYSLKHDMENETLPPAQELFDDALELDFKLLDKQFSIKDGDFSQCPPSHKQQLMNLLEEYSDRFSTSKLDIETTDLYVAELPTKPGKKVTQIGRAHV